MSESEKRFTLRLGMSDPEQRRAWEILSAIPKGKRNKYLYQLMLRKEEKEDIGNLVYGAVMRALADYGGPSLSQRLQPKSSIDSIDGQAGVIRSVILGFLSDLQAAP